MLDPSLNLDVLDSASVLVADVIQLGDGKILIAGGFETVDGLAAPTLARLNADGSLDASFTCALVDGWVQTFALDADGRIYLAGSFSAVGGLARTGLARLLVDGTIDPAFDPAIAVNAAVVVKLGVTADGGLYVGQAVFDGQSSTTVSVDRLTATGALASGFTRIVRAQAFPHAFAFGPQDEVAMVSTVNGPNTFADMLRRYLSNGLPDPAYQPGVVNTFPVAVLFNADGSMIVAGSGVGSQARPLARILSNGAVDETFDSTMPFSFWRGAEIIRLADDSLLVAGSGVISESAPLIARFTANGGYDASFNVQLAIERGQPSLQLRALAKGDFLVFGGFTTTVGEAAPHVAQFAPDGALRPGMRVDLLARGRVGTLTPFAGGDMLVGGQFAMLGQFERANLARLAANDQPVSAFPVTDRPVERIVIAPDGRAIVLGTFQAVPGSTTAGIFRISTSNAVDGAFLSGMAVGVPDFRTAAFLGDGSLVLGGDFEIPGHASIARLKPDGVFDADFLLNGNWSNRGPSGPVFDLAVDGSNRLLLTGSGGGLNEMVLQNVVRPGIARTAADGTLDAAFAPAVGVMWGARQITPLSDGDVLVLGARTDAPAPGYPQVVRFNPDGGIDESFTLGLSATEYVTTYTLTPANALLVATFDSENRTGRVRRYSMAGVVDPTFSVPTGTGGTVSTMTFDPQGRLWLGGTFDNVAGERRVGLARLAPPALFARLNGPVQVVVASGGSHTLSAEVFGATGSVTYQWRLNDAPLPGATGITLAVTAFDATKAGAYSVVVTDALTSLTSAEVSLVLPVAPAITAPPQDREGSTGGTVVLRVGATGRPAPTYQWFKDGVAIAGATAPELILRELTAADATSYTVQVTNLGGSTMSRPAVVTVTTVGIDPTFVPAVVGLSASTHAGVAAGQSDNSILVATYWGEALNGVSRSGLSRLHPNGALDPTFGLLGRNFARPLLVQPDGTAYLFEGVSTLTTSGTFLRRLLPSGALDPGFSPRFSTSYEITRLGVLADGRVVAAGGFYDVNGAPHPGIVRFLPDGTVDGTFNPGSITRVAHAAIHPDGTMVVVLQSGNEWVLRRLLVTGAVDATFPDVTIAGGSGGVVVERLPDESYLLLGHFDTVNGVARHRCARILATGELASGFADLPGSGSVLAAKVMPDGSVRALSMGTTSSQSFRLTGLASDGGVVLDRTYEAVFADNASQPSVTIQPDGGVVFGGPLLALDGHPVRGFARLNPTGDFDPSFQARVGTYDQVYSAHPLDAGRWGIFGRFTEVSGVSRPGVAVVGPDGQVDVSFVPEVPENAGILRGYELSGGRLLISGYFPPFSGGFAQESMMLLHADGSRDTSHDALFANGAGVPAVSPEGYVYRTVPVSNPPVFPTLTLTRLNPDLSPDPTFAPVTIQSGVTMRAVAGGEIFLYTENGTFTDSASQARTGLVRVGSDGLIDPTFTAPALSNPYNVLPLDAPNGKYIIAGTFTVVNGINRAGVARLNRDGSLDTTFMPPSSGLPPNSGIEQFAVDASGRVLVFGRYLSSTPLQQNESVLTRLNSDGAWDPGINYVLHTFTGLNISAIVPRENGDVLLAGLFAGLGGGPQLSLARLTAHRFQVHATRGRVAVPEGGDGFLELRLTGPVNLPTYRWTRNGQPVTNGDRAVLALRNVSAGDLGAYRAEVTSFDGTVVGTETIDVVLSTATVAAAQTPLTFSETGGLGGIRVDAPAGTSWSMAGVPPWMEIIAAPAATGSRTVSFTLQPNTTGATRSATVTLAGQAFEVQQAATSGRLVNISTRGRVGVGDDILIVGLITTGTAPLDFLGRGVGPTLGNYGLTGVLPDPAIDLKRGQVAVTANDDWDAGADRDAILTEGRRLLAFDLADGQGDAALLTNLSPGAYTALIYDPAGGQGIALAEFYDRTAAGAMDPYVRVTNISTRGRVGVGDHVLIAGFVITGPAPKQVLLRGVGPGLEPHGVARRLHDPFLRLVREGVTIAQNDDWAFSPQADLVAAASGSSGAFPLDPASRDAALVITLAPGAYTAIVAGADGGEGVAIVEVYDLE